MGETFNRFADFGCALHKKTFGGRTEPGPAGGAIAGICCMDCRIMYTFSRQNLSIKFSEKLMRNNSPLERMHASETNKNHSHISIQRLQAQVVMTSTGKP